MESFLISIPSFYPLVNKEGQEAAYQQACMQEVKVPLTITPILKLTLNRIPPGN